MVAVKQRLVRLTAQDRCDLPGPLVNVLHPWVETEPPGRRHFMCGIANQEDVADAVTVGDDGGCLPVAYAKHRDLDIRQADALADQGRAKLRGEVLRLPAVFLRAVN